MKVTGTANREAQKAHQTTPVEQREWQSEERAQPFCASVNTVNEHFKLI